MLGKEGKVKKKKNNNRLHLQKSLENGKPNTKILAQMSCYLYLS